MSYFDSLPSACALSATSVVREDIPPEKIHAVFSRNGFRTNHGSTLVTISESFKELGIEYEDMRVEARKHTLGEFCREVGTEGVLFVCSVRHAFCVIEGVPVDPYYGKPQMRSRVTSAWRIKNPVVSGYRPLEDQLRAVENDRTLIQLLASASAKRSGSNRYWNYLALFDIARELPGHHPKECKGHSSRTRQLTLTVGQAIAAGYSRTDIRWDLKKGHMRVVGSPELA